MTLASILRHPSEFASNQALRLPVGASGSLIPFALNKVLILLAGGSALSVCYVNEANNTKTLNTPVLLVVSKSAFPLYSIA